MVFVPEGPCDRSLARSAWDIATPREPSRRVRYDSCRCVNVDSVIEVIGVTIFGRENRRNLCVQETVHHIERSSHIIGHSCRYDRCCPTGRAFRRGRPPGLAAPDHTVPYGTDLSGHASQALHARLRSVVPTGRKYILRAEALIKLALMGFQPWAESSCPFGPEISRRDFLQMSKLHRLGSHVQFRR
jgi:hypothetical protein